MSVQIERAQRKDLSLFERMEQDPDTRDFIIPYSREDHVEKFANPNIVYLRLLFNEELVGFFILGLDLDDVSVEFRRIVVATKGKGIGQMAIPEMEDFCRCELNRKRIWLDVFAHNDRGRHIYEKLGYCQFGSSAFDGKPLLLYEKRL